MSDQPQDTAKERIPLHKKEEQLYPDIDLLSLAEQRAASAPIADFGVGIHEIKFSSPTALRTRTKKSCPARNITTIITRIPQMPDLRSQLTILNTKLTWLKVRIQRKIPSRRFQVDPEYERDRRAE